MQHEELRDRLQALGWRISKNQLRAEYNEANWYAWLPDRAELSLPHCECNDKPPSIVIEPFQFNMGASEARSVEFKITGEAGGNWYTLTMYSVPFTEAEAKIRTAIRGLGAAWSAVVAEVTHAD